MKLSTPAISLLLPLLVPGCDAQEPAEHTISAIEEADTDDLESFETDGETDTDGLADDTIDGLAGGREPAAFVPAGGVSVLNRGWSDGSPVALGSAADRTCFLEGFTGELRGAQGGPPARAEVYISGGQWYVDADPGIGSGLVTRAACIGGTYNRRTLSWYGNTDTGNSFSSTNATWIDRTPHTQCFLTSVHGTVGFQHPSTGVNLSAVQVWDDGAPHDAWKFSGLTLTEQDGSTGGGANAVCVDLRDQEIEFSFEAAADPNLSYLELASNDWTCAPQRIGGHLAYAPGGAGDGARVQEIGDAVFAKASSAKRIGGTCLKASRI